MQQSSMIGQIFPLLFMFGIFFLLFIYMPMKRRKQRAESSISNMKTQLADLRQKVLVVTGSTIPGKEIKNVLGNVTGSSKTAASTGDESEAAEKEALAALMENALEMGANAVIDLKMTSSSYEQQGSKWMVAKTFYTGTAVVI